SAMAMMIMAPNPNNTGIPAYSFQYRPTKGGTLGTGNYTAPAPAPGGFPHYLRLVRSGNTLTAYVSETNGSWVQVGSTSIPMGQSIFVGLATTSHNDGVLASAVYENVQVIGNVEENEGFAIRINAGGPELTFEGNVYAADQNFTGGKVYTNPSATVPTLYQTERSALPPTFGYDIPLENGEYNVILHFAEIYWGATGGGATGTGKRVFDVVMEDTTVLNNYDINAEVGPQTMVTETFAVTIVDGVLNMTFDASDGVNQPKLSAIEILAVSGLAPLGPLTLEDSDGNIPSTQVAGASNKFSITPNPTSVETSLSFELPTTIEIIHIYDLSGKIVQIINGGIIDDNGRPLNVQELPVGVYIVKAKDEDGTEYQQKLLITGN
ncbi:malectin domain-containing carbohydrate-binding protein, partial [Arenibacter sp. F26102]|uniref:malectin domain-containing carbohydrate-binding protein n=1 Tax=Arenibacter sp. F26102 TaxID=2926416 RepID=UPI001FF4A690